jgi:hypothetical protein
VTGTEIFKSYNNSDILLLKKKHPTDNLSKDLVVSGYTLEDLPSLQICKEENLIVYSKSNLTLYFAVHSIVLFKTDIANSIDDVVLDVDYVNHHTLPAVRKEEQESYRDCLMRRADFYQKEAYRHCSTCVGLFLFIATGMKMGCGHYICDSCICRHRGNMDVCGGSFDYPCPSYTESGTVCGEIGDLALADSSENLFHWRDNNFPALQRDYEPPHIDQYFGTPEIVQTEGQDFSSRMENVIVFDSHVEENKVDVILKIDETPIELPKKQSVVSFRTRDSYVEVCCRLQFISFEILLLTKKNSFSS